MVRSRTGNSIRNSIVALAYYFLNLVLNFVSRKIFLDHLGTEVLGLNTTATNLLQFLNLAELGIGFAVAFSLYSPIAKKEYEIINEIVSFQGHIYKRIARVVIVGAVILSAFFPLIFDKMKLPLWYAYASFGVLLYSALLTYFVNYRQIILTANQEEYKITLSYKVCLLIKVLVQIFVIANTDYGYFWWLVTEFVFSTIASVWLNIIIKKAHPYLQKAKSSFRELRKKYAIIEKKVKQLFFHKIAAFAVTQTSPIIIYAFLSLTVVAYYGNYLLVIGGCSLLMTSVFNGVGASIGNLIAEHNQKRIIEVFKELFCLRYLLTVTLCLCVYCLCQDFISLWIGKEYVLPRLTLLLMVTQMYFSLSRGTVDSFLNGYGLFKDIWAPVVEAVLNIGCSILGGYLYGLNGIIIGAIISQIVIIFFWKPYFLFKEGINESIGIYIKLYSQCLLVSVIPTALVLIAYNCNPLDSSSNVLHFIITASVIGLIAFTLLTVSIILFVDGGKPLASRLIHLIIKK